MNNSLIAKLATMLSEAADGAISPSVTNHQNLYFHDGTAYSLTSDAVIIFNEVVSKLLNHSDFSKKFSEKYIDKKIKNIFAKLISQDKYYLKNELKHLVQELASFNDSNVVYLRIEGIKLSICIIIGKVRILPADRLLLVDMLNGANKIIKTSKDNEETRESNKEFVLEQCSKEFMDGCVGIVDVCAEPTRALEIAKEEISRAIDLLQFTSKALSQQSHENFRIGLKGDIPNSVRTEFILSKSSFNLYPENNCAYREFEIDQHALESMENMGMFLISDALAKRQTNNLEESLIKSIHWYSVALNQNENSNSFLFLIVSLESLFMPVSGNSISGTVAESVAFLVADKLDSRKRILYLIKKYYGKRSSVAHGGDKTILDTELNTLMSITGTTIVKIIKTLGEFESQKQLMNWIEDMKLT